MPIKIGASEAGLIRSICRDSFFQFVREFWSVGIPEKPVWNWHIPYLCGIIQAAAERVFRDEEKLYDYIFNVSPGTTKSTIMSVMFPAWVWTRMPSARFICGSYTAPLALDLSRKCRDLVLSEKYRACFPDIALREDQNTKGYFANTLNGMRYAQGVGGSVIGMHGHFIIVDDPIDPTGTASDDEIIIANRWVGEVLPTRKVDKRTTVSMLIMQRLHQNDPTGYILDKKKGNIFRVCLPAELIKSNDGSLPDVQPPYLRRYYKRDLMDPTRLSKKILEDAYVDLGEYSFAAQYLQNPVPPGGGMIKVEKILLGPPPKRFDRIVRFWDKAGTKMGGTFTVGCKMGVYKDPVLKLPIYWVLDIVRGQWDTGERERHIKRIAAMDGKDVEIGIEQEPGSSGKESALATIRRLAGFRAMAARPTGDKTVRAEEFSTQVNSGAVCMAPGIWNHKYIQELKFFPHSTYKDQVDATSGAFSMLFMGRIRVGGMKKKSA